MDAFIWVENAVNVWVASVSLEEGDSPYSSLLLRVLGGLVEGTNGVGVLSCWVIDMWS